MRIADAAMMPKVYAPETGGNTGIANRVSSADDNASEADFPTFMNIPWQEQDAAEKQVPLYSEYMDVLTGGELPLEEAVDPAELVAPEEAKTDLPSQLNDLSDDELVKAIANGLLSVPNLSVTVSTDQPESGMPEELRLLQQYEKAVSNGNGPAFSWMPDYIFGKNAKGELGVLPPKLSAIADAMKLANGSKQAEVQNKPLPATLAAELANALKPGQQNQPLPYQTLPAVAKGAEAANVSAFGPAQGASGAGNASLQSAHVINQAQLNATKKDSHISFLQPVMVSQLPDMMSRIAKDAISFPAANIEMETQASAAAKSMTKLEIQLVPKNLGVVQITMQKQDGAVSIMIQAETAEAERLLASESGALKEALRNVGLSLEEMRVMPMAASDREGDTKFGRAFGSELDQREDQQEFDPTADDDADHQEAGLDGQPGFDDGLPVRNQSGDRSDTRNGLYL
ncbi:MAG: flagellar hook-length control protein FliK [Pseudomonadota bacterium]